MKRKHKLILYAISLTVCCILYLLYSMILVPNIILPEKNDLSSDDQPLNSSEEPSKLLDKVAHKIAPLFSDPNDWRLHTAYVINPKGDFGLILFKDAPVFSKDKRMITLTACTIILLDPDKTLSEEERYRRAVVLETNENVSLSFTRPISNFSLDFASFERGELNSRVIIRSNMSSSGPEDDFYLSTLNVSFTLKQIVAHHEVVFHFGEYDIDGEGLTIDLDMPSFIKSEKRNNDEESKEKSAIYQWVNQGNLGGGISIERVELLKLNRFKFKLNSDYLTSDLQNVSNASNDLHRQPESDLSDPDQPGESPSETLVEIQCKNGFYFASNPDVIGSWVGRFRNGVEVMLYNPDNTTNHLTCNNLYLYFIDQQLESLARQEKNFANIHLKKIPTGRLANLSPTKLKAIGNQESLAKIDSESYHFSTEADELIYDMIQKRILLRQTTPQRKVSLTKDDLKIQSSIIDYKIEEKQIGSVIAGGEGYIKTVLDNHGQKVPFNASWKNGLRIIADPNDPSLIRLSVVGGVRFEVEGIGTITALDADFWGFLPKTDDKTVSSGLTDGNFVSGHSSEENEQSAIMKNLSNIIPQSAQFRNNVRLETPRGLAVIKKELSLRFSLQNPAESLSGESNQIVNDLTGSDTKKQGHFFSESGSLFSEEQKSQFLLEGDLLDLWMILNGQNDINVSRIVLRENVRLQEKDLNQQTEMLNIQGDEVRIENPDSDQTEVLLVGKAARFKGKGLELSGNNIHVSRVENSFAVVGPGKLSFVPDISKLSPSPQTNDPIISNSDLISHTESQMIRNVNYLKNSDVSSEFNPETFQETATFQENVIAQETPSETENNLADSDLQNQLMAFLSDEPIQVVWSKQMKFDGQNLFFQSLPNQNIDVTQGNQKIRCPEIKLSLPNKISIFDLDYEKNKTLDIDLVECLGDLSHPIQIELFSIQRNTNLPSDSNVSSDSNVLSKGNQQAEINAVYRAQFKNLQFRRSTGNFLAEGPGWIRTTMKTPVPEKQTQPTSENSVSFKPWTQAHLIFQKEIEGNIYQKELTAQNMVNCVVCTTNQFESTIDLENPETFPQDSIFLICQKLLGTVLKNPATDKEAIEMTASENTLLRYKNIVIRSETINYSDIKKTVRFAGDGINAASIHKQEYPGATVQSLGKYMRASYNLETEKIEVEQYSNSGN